ncbi:MAG: hypothetical protein M1818_007069 [Claussenomyces sp. TS43310]|nr:MAG: hypothetical protein M1818_007069 [Claussenomyces sp. TS43310]
MALPSLEALSAWQSNQVVYEASEDFFFAVQLRRYSIFMDFIFWQNLQGAPLLKPILNGNDIKELFNLDKTGAVIKTILDGLLKWQFDHEGSSRDEAKDWLYTQKEVLGIL